MALIGMRGVRWGFDDPPLLENIDFQVEKGERVCLVGRNGVGKSTLFRILAGDMLPDAGEVWRQQGVRVAALEQEVPSGFDGAVFDVVALGLGDQGEALVEYNRLCNAPDVSKSKKLVKKRDERQQSLEADGGWELFNRVESVLSRTGLDGNKAFSSLSAGMKRRALLARAIAQSPDVLLLDEPTNHFDIESIVWMEQFILRHVKTLLFITHDRAFLKNLATRIMELERGALTSYACDYPTYVERRQAALEAEENENRRFDKKLSQEEIWIRQGIKARRTRNQGRKRALLKMREEYRARRKSMGTANLKIQEAERTGKLVVEAKRVNFSYRDEPVVKDFSTLIMRGDKVGIIGPNGVGKTTILKILLKEIEPDSGTIRHGTNIQAAYFDQLRMQLDEEKTVAENIMEGNDFIVFNGQKRHVISHLKDFLFSPQRCRMPVHVLSGGEKNRLMLAKLFTRPANLLVFDEPTNDLDAETLELLEELLFEFSGTVLLVSHDREFLNNVVTSTLSFDGGGQVVEYAGGYDDWLLQRPAPETDGQKEKKANEKPARKPKPSKPVKLTFKEKLELEELPAKIDGLEARQKKLYGKMSDPAFYKTGQEEIARMKAELEETEMAIEEALLRWEELESKTSQE